jgi:hypothetical protein
MLELDPRLSLLGFGVGILVGLTSVGGGSLLTPLLVLVFRIPPVIAVGTDLAHAAITRIFGGLQHWRQGTVELKVALFLALGSVPASVLGVMVLGSVQRRDPYLANEVVTKFLVVALILAAVALLVRRPFKVTLADGGKTILHRARRVLLILIGAGVGLFVGLTSVGSGVLIFPALALLFPWATAKLVGTDITHAALLTLAAALAHGSIGNVNLALTLSLLLGSVPGVLLGSRLCVWIPDKALRPFLCLLLVGLAVRLA